MNGAYCNRHARQGGVNSFLVAVVGFHRPAGTSRVLRSAFTPHFSLFTESGSRPARRSIPRHAVGLFPLPVPGSLFPVPAAPSPGMPGVCFPDSRLPPPLFTLCLCTIACCEKATLSAPRHRCEKSNAVSVFGTHQGMYMTRAPKRRKKSKTLSSFSKTGLKSVKFGTLFALPILTFHPSNPSGASARAVLTLQKGQKGGAPL